MSSKFDWLDPINSFSLRHHFEYENEFAERWRKCQVQYPDKVFDTFIGAEKLKILDKRQCAEIRELIYTDSPTLKDFYSRINILSHVFTPEVDARIKAYFRSNYTPIWCKFYANQPHGPGGTEPAFSWHQDAGPTKHLKLLIYLNSSEESGGNTHYINKQETELFEEIGYTFCPLERRVRDLSEIAELYKINFNPIILDIQEGEGLLFEPANILHKGIWPSKALRYIMQICILPSALSWRNACQEFQLPREDNAWPGAKKWPGIKK